MSMPKVVVVSGLAFILLACGYLFNTVVEQKNAQIKQLQQIIGDIRAHHRQDREHLEGLRLDLQNEQANSTELVEQLASSQQALGLVQQKLAIYQKIMTPEMQAGGISVDKLAITPLLSSNYYRFEALLLQTARKKRWLSGELELLVSGSLEQKPQTFSLIDLLPDEQALAFKFKYFQQVSVEFSLPEGFKPEQVKLQVKLKGDKRNKAAVQQIEKTWSAVSGE